MTELSQVNFNRAELIADNLHDLAGLAAALSHELIPILQAAPAKTEQTINALIGAMTGLNEKSTNLAGDIARSGAEKGTIQ